MRAGLPFALPGQVVGLLGGSFDPAHLGHAHVTREAIKRLALDRVWWLVSPGNPLKAREPAPLARRLAQARAVMAHPRVDVTDVEARLGTRHTARTVGVLQARHPGVRFVWLMGADNLAGLHLWEDWRTIMARVPVAVLARPGTGFAALSAPAARAYRRWRVPPRGIGLRSPPAWAFVEVPMHPASSTAIRARGGWS